MSARQLWRCDYERRNNCVKRARWSARGDRFLCAARDGTTRVWRRVEHDDLHVVSEQQSVNARNSVSGEAESKKQKKTELASSVWAEESRSQWSGPVCDVAWHPLQSDVFCCFAASAPSQPILLRDAHTGATKAVYSAYDHLDRHETSYAIAWRSDGCALFGASRSSRLRVWDASRPGRAVYEWQLDSAVARKQKKTLLAGQISCVEWSQECGMLAVGSYGGDVALMTQDGHRAALLSSCQSRGVTQVLWHGHDLYVGGRKSESIGRYDTRMLLPRALVEIPRVVSSHQHVYFDVRDGRLFSGDTTEPLGLVSVFNVENGDLLENLSLHRDVVASVELHPSESLLLSGCGQRRIEKTADACENSAAVWAVEI